MSSDVDVKTIRRDFPILSRRLGSHPLVYLDSANTSQKPESVIDADRHYREHNANVARAMHALGSEATQAYEGARARIAGFIGAAGPDEVVFTKNASEALNLAAGTLGARLGPGDEVVVATQDTWYVYTVETYEIVEPHQVEVLSPVPDDPEAQPTERYLTMTTCHSLSMGEWGNDHRWIVHAKFSYWMPRSEGRPDSVLNDPEVN